MAISKIKINGNMYDIRDSETAEQAAINKSTLGYQKKNLLINNCKTKTTNGVTATVNDDKSITLSGVSSKNIDYLMFVNMATGVETTDQYANNKKFLPNGKYIVSGGDTNCAVQITVSADNTTENNLAASFGNDVAFTIKDNNKYVWFRLLIKANADFSTPVTVYPMIRLAEVTDNTYEPYQPSVDERLNNINNSLFGSDLLTTSTPITETLDSIKNYVGYEEPQVLGLQADYQNKIFTRLGATKNLSAGSDFNTFTIYNNRRRCNVADDGTINAFYGKTGYIEDGSNGQVMVYQPKFYYKVTPLKLEPITNGQGYHIRKANYYISETPREGFKLHPAFYDINGNEIDYYLTGAYEASIYDTSASIYITDDAQIADFATDKICSIANVKPMSGLTQDLTRVNCEKLATNRGSDWHNTTLAIESAEQLLMMIEMGEMNFQSTIGKGVTELADGTGNISVVTGGTSNLGNSTGMASGTNGRVSVSYRGRENPYGNIWAFVNGVNIWGDGKKKGGIPYIATSFTFTEDTKTGYESAGFTTAEASNYISAMGYGNPKYDWIFFASETNGNSALPVGDYQYYTANLNGYRVTRLGGGWLNGSEAGSFYWTLANASSVRHRSIGGRAAFIPTKTDI